MYVGGLYEKVTLPGGQTEERHTVGGHTLVTYTGRTAGGAGTVKTRYLLRDHLGSALTERGFTGHRQLDGVGLIHMGGRVYDAEIGRFLSADPFVGGTADLQALNRYSYVQNNPLSYTDPSGYFLKKLVKGIGRAIGLQLWVGSEVD